MERASSAGRRGAAGESRALVTLASSLSEAGDSLTAEAVAARLDVSEEEALKLIDLLACAAPEGGAALPLVEEGPGELSLLRDEGVRGRALRLTRAEALALAAALDRLGVAREDPLRTEVERSLFSSPVDEGLVRGLVAPGGVPEGRTLATCARAISSGRALALSYQGTLDATPSERLVVPEALRCEGSSWYLDGWDADRGGRRTFRLDRMGAARVVDRPSGALPADGAKDEARSVRLLFRDPRYLDLLPWHNLTVEGTTPEGSVAASTPYYGGMWLPRMVAACAGTVTTDDAEVGWLARRLARDLLGL